MAAEEPRPRSRWCGSRGPRQGALSRRRTRQSRVSVSTFPFCPAASPGTRLLHARYASQKLSNSVSACGRKIISTEVFIFSGKGAKLELPRQENSLCFIVMTEAEGQTNLRIRGSSRCRRSVPTTWFQAKNPKSSKSSQFRKNF